MIEQLAGLIPRLKVAVAKTVERKSNLMDEHNEKEDPLEKRENGGSSKGSFLDQRGNLFDQLL